MKKKVTYVGNKKDGFVGVQIKVKHNLHFSSFALNFTVCPNFGTLIMIDQQGGHRSIIMKHERHIQLYLINSSRKSRIYVMISCKFMMSWIRILKRSINKLNRAICAVW